MTAKLILLAVAVVLASSANAGAKGSGGYNSAQQDIRFTKMDDQVTEKQIEAFKKVIEDVNKNLGSLAIPQGVEIRISSSHANPAAYPLEKAIDAGVRYLLQVPADANNPEILKNYYKAPSVSFPILAHEYGHLIFLENYSIKEPIWPAAWKAYKEKMPEMDRKQHEIFELIEELNVLHAIIVAPESSNEEIATAFERIKEIMKKVQVLNAEINSAGALVAALSAITTSYNEFFADVIAVLYSGNADSIKGGIAFTRVLQGNNKYTKHAKISNSERDFTNNLKHENDYNPHGYFAQVRSELWSSYLVSPSYRKSHRAAIIEAVFEAVASECSRLIHGTDETDFSKPETWQDLNDRLMDGINRELAARGIQALK